MPHSVTCGSCNATFSIPDEVWEKRVEGQLATLKCRQCKAPIQIDGRARRGTASIADIRPTPFSAAMGASDQSSLEEPTTIWTAPPPTESTLHEDRKAKKAASEQSDGVDTPPEQHRQVLVGPTLSSTKSTGAGSNARAKVTPRFAGVGPNATVEVGGLRSVLQSKDHAESRPREEKQHIQEARGTSGDAQPRRFQATSKPEDAAPPADRTADKQKQATANPHKALATPKAVTHVQVATHGKPPATEPGASAKAEPSAAQAPKTASAQESAQPDAASNKLDKPAEAVRSPTSTTIASEAEQEKPSSVDGTPAKIHADASPPVGTKSGSSRGGGPPPLRKALPSTSDQDGSLAQPGSPAGSAERKPNPGGPPPLPRQPAAAPAADKPAWGETAKEAPRVHSPASMPVVAAMAVPFAPRTPSAGAPRPSDIAALVKIRPKFPKWLPFAVLGATVLAVAALAGLSWIRGDAAPDKANATASKDAKVAYPETTGSTVASKPTAAPVGPSPSADNAAASAAFASQFAQAAAKQRPTTRFDREAAEKALAPNFAKAASCHNKGDPTGSAPTTISISPSGQVLSVTIGPPFTGTYTAECIRNTLVDGKCPPFQGAPGRLVHSISIH